MNRAALRTLCLAAALSLPAAPTLATTGSPPADAAADRDYLSPRIELPPPPRVDGLESSLPVSGTPDWVQRRLAPRIDLPAEASAPMFPLEHSGNLFHRDLGPATRASGP
jgi:hypothetical protein